MVEKIKTGTTCIGFLFKGGVLLAADRRSSVGYISSDRIIKVFDVSKNIVSTVAGYASDCQLFMRIISGELSLLRLKSEREPMVREAAMILNSMQYSSLRRQGSVVSLIVGGYDEKEGFSLYDLSPDGTISAHEGYVTDGSGGVWVKGIFDNEYSKDMSEKEAVALAQKAFLTAFKNDNASGGGFVIKVVTKDGIKTVERKIVKSELVSEEKM